MPDALRLFNMLGGFGKTRGVNRSSLFSDGMSKGVSKLSEIGNTPDSEIKRSSTGKHTVETDGSGQITREDVVKEDSVAWMSLYYNLNGNTDTTFLRGTKRNYQTRVGSETISKEQYDSLSTKYKRTDTHKIVLW